jgi:hypothetical protein
MSLILAILMPGIVPEHAVSVALDDTYFVVAHFHASIVLASSLLVVTLVAYKCHSLNWAIHAAWAFMLLHAVAAIVAWRVSVSLTPTPATVSFVPPAYPGFAYLYLGSAAMGLVLTLFALLVSLVRALQSQGVAPA